MDIETVRQMKTVDVRTVDKATLVDIKDVEIDANDAPEKKMAEFVRQIKNPYFFLCNGYAVKLEFADTDRTIEDRFMEYINTLL